MPRNVRILFILFLIVLLNLCIPIYSNALNLNEIVTGGQNFLTADGGGSLPVDQNSLNKLSNSVSGILLSIAIIVTLVSAVIMGINFTVQSVEDKAKIKESMIPWVIGIIVSFGAFTIWKITMAIFYNI